MTGYHPVGIGPHARVFADNLVRIRRRRGLTVRDVSWLMRERGRVLLPSGVTNIETLRRRTDIDDVFALAAVLDCTVEELLGLTSPPTLPRVPDPAVTELEEAVRRAFAEISDRLRELRVEGDQR